MQTPLTYRHRLITEEDIVFIRQLIAEHPGLSRRRLSAKLCAAWNWNQANGTPCDMVCRGMMLMLHRAALIELPPVRHVPRNPMVERSVPARVSVDETPLWVSLGELGPLEVRQVRRTPEEALFNSLIQHHHYLGYARPVGEHLKYLISARGRPVACMAWSSAPRHLGSRDRYIVLGAASAAEEHPPARLQPTVPDIALGEGCASGFAHSGAHRAKALGRLAAYVWTLDLFFGDIHRSATLSRHLLPCGELDLPGGYDRTG